MPQFKRYAVYYAPEPGPLAEFGARWLGWDLAQGQPVAHPDMDSLNIAELTKTPRKYGLHGTVKPPFHLSDGFSFNDLEEASQDLCRHLPPVQLDGLHLSRLGGFLALTPVGDTQALADLASTIVAELDAFRASPSEAELARRRKANLSAQQEALLQRWGYPYVMEEFRFHITLTGRMSRPEAETLRTRLEPVFASILPHPFRIQSLALVGEDTDGRFHLIRRLPLGA